VARVLPPGGALSLPRVRAWLVAVAPRWLKQSYPTPKVDVRGVVFVDGRVLLVRELGDGRWALPGGWADVGESLSEAVVREVREESGYETRAVKLLAVANLGRYQDGRPLRPNIYKLFVRCELVVEEPGPIHGAETTEARFFAENELPVLSAPRGTPAQLARLFEHARNPDLPADFD
jgi:ADP-ribose pyrophosphatase YjhB (NUDIX family)